MPRKSQRHAEDPPGIVKSTAGAYYGPAGVWEENGGHWFAVRNHNGWQGVRVSPQFAQAFRDEFRDGFKG